MTQIQTSPFFVLPVLVGIVLFTIGFSIDVYAETTNDNDSNLFTFVESTIDYAVTSSAYNSYTNLETTIDVSNILQANFDTLGLDYLKLDLFGDVIQVNKNKIDTRSSNDFTWYGTVDGSKQSSVIMVIKEDRITGTIKYEQKEYSIKPLNNGLHVILDVDASKYPREHPPEFSTIEKETLHEDYSFLDDDNFMPLSNNDEVITVMVVYTSDAASYAGDIHGLIQLAVDEANQGYDNSSITIDLELVHTYQVNYTEYTFSVDHHRLKGTSDGNMDEIHQLRDQYAADVVVLISNLRNFCGLADVWQGDESKAFGVVSWTCATGSYSFAHEIGHIQGAAHNPENAQNTTFAYGHGYYYEPDSWRTIMSYVCPTDCAIISYWSNPDIFYNGIAMGNTTTHDNARVLDETSNIIASFRNGCLPPASGDWIVTQSCAISLDSTINNGNLLVQNNSVLTINGHTSLDVDLINHYINVELGSAILIKLGSKIY